MTGRVAGRRTTADFPTTGRKGAEFSGLLTVDIRQPLGTEITRCHIIPVSLSIGLMDPILDIDAFLARPDIDAS
jgi:hypothetical protein